MEINEKKDRVINRFVKLPDKLRVKNSAGIDGITAKSKFVYLIISWHKYVYNNDSPSFKCMKERFGINRSIYLKAIKELSESKFIKCKRISSGYGSIDISILSDNNERFSMIPSAIVTTRTLTNSHKIFFSIIWKLFRTNHSSGESEINLTVNELVKQIEKVGFSKNFIYKYMKEMSDESYGYIPLIMKNGNKYTINFENLFYISEYEFIKRENEYMSRNKFKYVSPVPFEYSIDKENQVVVRNKMFDKFDTKTSKKFISDIEFNEYNTDINYMENYNKDELDEFN